MNLSYTGTLVLSYGDMNCAVDMAHCGYASSASVTALGSLAICVGSNIDPRPAIMTMMSGLVLTDTGKAVTYLGKDADGLMIGLSIASLTGYAEDATAKYVTADGVTDMRINVLNIGARKLSQPQITCNSYIALTNKQGQGANEQLINMVQPYLSLDNVNTQNQNQQKLKRDLKLGQVIRRQQLPVCCMCIDVRQDCNPCTNSAVCQTSATSNSITNTGRTTTQSSASLSETATSQGKITTTTTYLTSSSTDTNGRASSSNDGPPTETISLSSESLSADDTTSVSRRETGSLATSQGASIIGSTATTSSESDSDSGNNQPELQTTTLPSPASGGTSQSGLAGEDDSDDGQDSATTPQPSFATATDGAQPSADTNDQPQELRLNNEVLVAAISPSDDVVLNSRVTFIDGMLSMVDSSGALIAGYYERAGNAQGRVMQMALSDNLYVDQDNVTSPVMVITVDTSAGLKLLTDEEKAKLETEMKPAVIPINNPANFDNVMVINSIYDRASCGIRSKQNIEESYKNNGISLGALFDSIQQDPNTRLAAQLSILAASLVVGVAIGAGAIYGGISAYQLNQALAAAALNIALV